MVLDSSFNPPTRAHTSIAREALGALEHQEGATRLLLLLSVNNADKAPKPASFPVRLGMMDAAARELLGEEGRQQVDVDVAVTTKAFFHDKARAIARSGFYGVETTQVFLAGFDTLVRIFDPKYYGGLEGMRAALDGLFATARLRVTTRPDGELWGGTERQRAEVERLEAGGLEEVGGRGEWMGRVDVVEGGEEGEGVSSSRVREAVGAGRGVDGLVGGEVEAWIEGERLYREGRL